MHAVPALTVPAPAARAAAGPIGIARAVAADPALWRPLLVGSPGGRRVLLERTATAEVWLLRWLPGQGTDLHVHASPGAFTVVAGALTERVVAPGTAVEVTRILPAGRTRAFGPCYRHLVRNAGDRPAVSVHVHTR